eukprot:Awhi_evm7s12155
MVDMSPGNRKVSVSNGHLQNLLKKNNNIDWGDTYNFNDFVDVKKFVKDFGKELLNFDIKLQYQDKHPGRPNSTIELRHNPLNPKWSKFSYGSVH